MKQITAPPGSAIVPLEALLQERDLRHVTAEEVDVDNVMLVVIVLAVIAAAAVAWMYMQRQRVTRVKERFGPEFDRTVKEAGTPEKAAAALENRVKRVEKFNIRKLTPEQARSFDREWQRVQSLFVDDPDGAVESADALVTQVMSARGYPMEDFDTRAADVSVDHPRVVENYRAARILAERRRRGEAGTEELRQAIVNYRALFEDLLETSTDAPRPADVRPHRRAS